MIITVLQVKRDEMDAVSGKPWAEAIAGRSGDLRQVVYGTRPVQRSDGKPQTGVFCPLNHAWLREQDGRAFLYVQHYDLKTL